MKRRILKSAVLVLLLVSGCSGGDGAFDNEGGADVTCLRHQDAAPGRAYAAGGDTARILQMLRYYTANGRRPYCDGRPATRTDHAWRDRYVQLGADAKNVETP